MARLQSMLLFIACYVNFLNADPVHEMQMVSADSGPMGRVLGLIRKPCTDPPTDPLVIVNNLTVSPSPIILGGSTLTLGLDMDVKEDLIGDKTKVLSAKLDVKMFTGKAHEEVDLCPLLPPDYCNIEDVCTRMAKYASICPHFLKDIGISCKCPIQAKKYKVSDVKVPLPSIPSGMNGKFDVELDLFYAKKKAGCLRVIFCLNTC